jgi:hypothetical protein
MNKKTRKEVLLTFCILQFAVCICTGQVTFYKEYQIGRQAEGHAVLQVGANYVTAGTTFTSLLDSNYIFMLKTDSIGDTVWTRTYAFKQTLYISSPNALQEVNNGGYILTGFARNANQNDSIFILRTDSGGTMMWFKFLAAGTVEIAANSIQPTLDGGSIIGGHYFPTLTAQNIVLAKIDSLGNMLWSKGIVVDNDAQATCVRATADSGYIITGEAARRVYLVKTNKNGTVVWSKVYAGSTPYDIANIVQQTSDGGYIVSGTLTNDTSGVSRMFLLKTNSDGDMQWTHSYVGTSEFTIAADGADALQTTDNGFAMTGYTVQPGSGAHYICLIKTDTSGNVMWTRTYGTNDSADASALALKQTDDNGFIIAGKGNDAFLIKTDITGRAYCADTTITINTDIPDFVTFFALIQDSTLSVNASFFPLKQNRGASVHIVCNPIGIDELQQNDDADFVIYPNPTDGEFSIYFDKEWGITSPERKESGLELEIRDVTGRITFYETSLQSSTFNFQLQSGIYFVKLIEGTKTAVRKLVVQ